jgi:hypothetical protein
VGRLRKEWREEASQLLSTKYISVKQRRETAPGREERRSRPPFGRRL